MNTKVFAISFALFLFSYGAYLSATENSGKEASTSGALAIKILRPMEREIIHYRKTSLRIQVQSQESTMTSVPYSIRDENEEILQSGDLSLSSGLNKINLLLEQKVKDHRGGFLHLAVGDDKVEFGLGLLFLVAGQSNTVNAECGQCNYHESEDPRVVYLKDPKATFVPYRPPYSNQTVMVPSSPNISARMIRGKMTFAPLTETIPEAQGSAKNVWLRVGKALAEIYNMPVGFVIAGVAGTSVKEWLDTFHARLVYGTKLNLTGVLWHQGESDAALKTNPDVYYNQLTTLISQSMSSIAAPWVVARTSICIPANTTPSSIQAIESAQNKVILTSKLNYKVFAGPNTNQIQHECHFDSHEQYNALINAWVKNLKKNGLIKN